MNKKVDLHLGVIEWADSFLMRHMDPNFWLVQTKGDIQDLVPSMEEQMLKIEEGADSFGFRHPYYHCMRPKGKGDMDLQQTA